MQDKISMGKKSRADGQRFEKRVRADLEKKYVIVDKWTNNVTKPFEQDIGEWVRALEPAKPKFIFNPVMKRRVMVGNSSGFPDFIVLIKAGLRDDNRYTFDALGVESKMTGKLDKEEKEKCRWLLDKHIFTKILIASKGEKRGSIKYTEFENV